MTCVHSILKSVLSAVSSPRAEEPEAADRARGALLYPAADGGHRLPAPGAHRAPRPQARQHAAQRRHERQDRRLRSRHPHRLRRRKENVRGKNGFSLHL